MLVAVLVFRGPILGRLRAWGILSPPGHQRFVAEKPGPSLREVARFDIWLVYDIAFFPDGQQLLISGATESFVSDARDLKPKKGAMQGGDAVDVSSTALVAMYSQVDEWPRNQKRFCIIDSTDWSRKFHIDLPGSWPTVRFTPDSRLLASVQADGWLKFWDVDSGREVRRLELPKTDTGGTDDYHLEFDASGKWLVIDGVSHPNLIDVDRLQIVERLPEIGSAPCISPDGSLIAYGIGDVIYTYDVVGRFMARQRQWRWGTGSNVGADMLHGGEGAFSPDSRLLAVCGYRGHVALFDAQDGALCDQHLEFNPHGTGIAWSPDGTRLAACGNGGVVLYEVVRPPGWK